MNFEKPEMFRLDVEMKERKNSRTKIFFVCYKKAEFYVHVIKK